MRTPTTVLDMDAEKQVFGFSGIQTPYSTPDDQKSTKNKERVHHYTTTSQSENNQEG